MLDKRILEGEIANLEKEKMTMGNLQKLAILYMCKDHLEDDERKYKKDDVKHIEKIKEIEYVEPRHHEETKVYMMGEPHKEHHKSELEKAIEGKNDKDLMKVFDEHMEVIKEFMPREHKALMNKLKDL